MQTDQPWNTKNIFQTDKVETKAKIVLQDSHIQLKLFVAQHFNLT